MAGATVVQESTFSVGELIDGGKVSSQHLLVVGLCLIFNMLDGFDITAMAVTAMQPPSPVGDAPIDVVASCSCCFCWAAVPPLRKVGQLRAPGS